MREGWLTLREGSGELRGPTKDETIVLRMNLTRILPLTAPGSGEEETGEQTKEDEIEAGFIQEEFAEMLNEEGIILWMHDCSNVCGLRFSVVHPSVCLFCIWQTRTRTITAALSGAEASDDEGGSGSEKEEEVVEEESSGDGAKDVLGGWEGLFDDDELTAEDVSSDPYAERPRMCVLNTNRARTNHRVDTECPSRLPCTRWAAPFNVGTRSSCCCVCATGRAQQCPVSERVGMLGVGSGVCTFPSMCVDLARMCTHLCSRL